MQKKHDRKSLRNKRQRKEDRHEFGKKKASWTGEAAQEKLLVFPLGDSAFLRRLYVVYSPDRYMPEKTRNFLHFIKKYYDISLA